MTDITIKAIEQIPPYEGPHAIPSIRFRPAREALGVSAWGMSIIEIDAHCSDYPRHDHAAEAHEEVYLVLQGSLVLEVDDAKHPLVAGQLARVPPEAVRKLVTLDEGATVLALGGNIGRAYAPAMGSQK